MEHRSLPETGGCAMQASHDAAKLFAPKASTVSRCRPPNGWSGAGGVVRIQTAGDDITPEAPSLSLGHDGPAAWRQLPGLLGDPRQQPSLSRSASPRLKAV